MSGKEDTMTNKNLALLATWLMLLAGLAWASWQMAAGVFIGVGVAIYVYQRRHSVVDEIEAEASWVQNWRPEKLEEYGEEYTRWHGFGRPLFIIFLVVVVVVVIIATAI